MIILGIDTSDSRGSVAVRKDGRTLQVAAHESQEDYSSWLLPAVEGICKGSLVMPRDADVLAVSTGPGSFTGLRVGLTAVKAWAEVYGKKIVGVSRLEAMAGRAKGEGYIASCYDAQRGHVFGGIFRRVRGEMEVVEGGMVVSPEEFLGVVAARCGSEAVAWVAMDGELMKRLPGWEERMEIGDTMTACGGDVARSIAELGEERARKGQFTDALVLDANYVRRSDAEIFWKEKKKI